MSRNLRHGLLALLPLLGMALIIVVVSSIQDRGSGDSPEVVNERIRPEGYLSYPEDPRLIKQASQEPVEVDEPAPAAAATTVPAIKPAATVATPGKLVFDSACQACHATGAAGAPRVGDDAAWASRLAQGESLLIKHAIDGFQGSTGFMPAKGGRIDLSDEQIAAAVRYMISYSEADSTATPVAAATIVVARVEPSSKPAPAVKPSAPRKPKVERVSLRPQPELMSGPEVYEHGCYVCHGPGLTGAPKLDDRQQWRKRLREKGRELLYRHAIDGFRGVEGPMPPRGGYSYLTDEEVQAAVNFMLQYRR